MAAADRLSKGRSATNATVWGPSIAALVRQTALT